MAETENMGQVKSVAALSEQFEEIINNYQTVLDATEREKEDALIQSDLYKAKAESAKAARDSLVDSLKLRRPIEVKALLDEEAVTSEKLAQELKEAKRQIEGLTIERDSLQKALKEADLRMRELEAEVKESKVQAAAPAPAAPETEPGVLMGKIVSPEPEQAADAVPAVTEDPAAENPQVEAVPEVPAPETPKAEAAPEVPAPEAEPAPDFEDQKKVLREMQEELARLEEKLRSQQK